MKNRTSLILATLLFFSVSYIVYNSFKGDQSNQAAGEDQLYTCGMHPEIISDEPGNCPICEMKLTPILKGKDSENQSDLIVDITPEMQQRMNIKLTTVEPGTFSTSIETNGSFTFDERTEQVITSRTMGWVEKLYVNYTGMNVSAGQKLMEVYSPEIVAAQQEYLTALKYTKTIANSNNGNEQSSELIQSAKRKLQLLRVTDAEIKQLEESGQVQTLTPIYSPVSGTVMMKEVVQGQKIDPEMPLLKIVNLSSLWLIADIYESDYSQLRTGSSAKITVDAIPGKTYNGTVSFIYPELDMMSRTAKVRIEVPNYDGTLKPNMFAKATITGTTHTNAIKVRSEAIIKSGKRNIVILSLGEGKFVPVEVNAAESSEDYTRIISGVNKGDVVVLSAQFLIDSEANLRSAINRFVQPGKSEVKPENNQNESTGPNQSVKTPEVKKAEEKPKNPYGIESPLIRTGMIDVESIDSDKNGKLFQCPMDWDIISNEAGRCPVCEMKFKEYSLEDIKKNLTTHGYKYK
ncbi:MAG: efflux RND transporter periplasmic adaptor subunit [Ignavibacteriaceae bacterium]|nr:efflux RND transporter periplasmic adaptor subunit [Ignavibacteriaceae bacterium]